MERVYWTLVAKIENQLRPVLNDNLTRIRQTQTCPSDFIVQKNFRMRFENCYKLWANINGKSYGGLAGEPRLWDYYDYPELFLVDYNFCAQK